MEIMQSAEVCNILRLKEAVCEDLDLDSTFTVQYFINTDKGEKMAGVLKEYTLVEKATA
jgi:hypothetical protein